MSGDPDMPELRSLFMGVAGRPVAVWGAIGLACRVQTRFTMRYQFCPAILVTGLLTGCASTTADPVMVDPGEVGSGSASGTGSGSGSGSSAPLDVIPDIRCTGTPDAGPAGSFDHWSSHLIALGSPVHRGFDLVAPASAATQTIEGWISYTIADKALEDERVELFACRQDQWQPIGAARTDGEGHFALALTDVARLPIGMRDLYVSVVGDRTGARFLGYVAPDNSSLVISDVDGTLTSSENAFLYSIATGATVTVQPDAATELGALAVHHAQIVYLTARGSQYSEVT